MTPQEAGIALRDDPTFASMSVAEQQTEAGLLLGTDDPLDIAIAIETALAEPAIMAQAALPVFEECRLPTPCGGSEPIAGNGRCMTCGANRLSAATEAPTSAPAPPVGNFEQVLPGEIKPMLAKRVQETLGLKYHELGDLLGVSRPTAQAYVSGRLAERVEGVRGEYLLRLLDQRGAAIDELRAELRLRLGK